MAVRVSHESARGCGFRRAGGIYLVGPETGRACCILPMPLHVCPTCHAGIKPARGWTWIEIAPFVREAGPLYSDDCLLCPLSQMAAGALPDRVGLLWVGEQFYATPDAFLAEAREVGVSRRIAAVPRDFVLGETWVALAHRTGVVLDEYEQIETTSQSDPAPTFVDGDRKKVAAIFSFFRPTAIERIVTEEEAADPEALAAIEAKGMTPVLVRRVGEQADLDLDDASEAGK